MYLYHLFALLVFLNKRDGVLSDIWAVIEETVFMSQTKCVLCDTCSEPEERIELRISTTKSC